MGIPTDWQRMSDSQWQLTPELETAIKHVTNDLYSETQDLHSAFDDSPEKWKDSEEGQNIGTWIDGLEQLVETLEDTDVKQDDSED
jgi:hypothetical protein